MKIIFFFSFIILILFSSSSFSEPVFYGDEVVVTATRSPVFKSEQPWSLSVISREEIENAGADDLGEIIKPVLGSQVKGTGFKGSLSTLKLRGNSSENVLVLLNGARISSTLLGLSDLSDIPINNIDRIEVVRGSSSAIYGSDAIGGIVNIITLRNSKDSGSSISLSHGSFNSSEFGFNSQGPWYNVSASYKNSLGFRENSAYELSDMQIGLVNEFGKSNKISLDAYVYSAKKELPGVPEDENEPGSASTPDDRQADNNSNLAVTYARALSNNSGIEIKAYQAQSYQKTHLYDFFASSFVDSSYLSKTNALEIKHNLIITKRNKLTCGVDLREELGQSHYAGNHVVSNSGLYIQDELRLRDDIFLNIGIRTDSHSESEPFTSSRIGLLQKVNDNFSLKTSFGNSFRSPTLNQLYWNDPAWLMYGDPNLSPEKAQSFDMGLIYKDAFDLEIGYFANTVSDMIVWHYDPATWTTTASNIDTAVIQGIEGSLQYKANDYLSFLINGTLQNPVRAYDESNPSLSGKDLPYTPRSKGSFQIGIGKKEDLFINVIGNYSGARYADGENMEELHKYFVLDMNTIKQIEDLTFNFKIGNILGAEYFESLGIHPVTYEYMGYPMPGRTYKIGVEYHY